MPLKRLRSAALLLGALSPAAIAGQVTLTFIGSGQGADWATASNWNGGGTLYPQNGIGANTYNAVLPGANDVQIGRSHAQNIRIDSLSSAGPSSLEVLSGSTLTVGTLTGSGTIVTQGPAITLTDASNFHGQIDLTASPGVTNLLLTDHAQLNGSVHLQGPGAFLPSSSLSSVGGVTGLESATNLGTITGSSASIGNLAFFSNQGTLNSTVGFNSDNTLEVSSYKFENFGQIVVDSGTTLQIASPHFLNYDGANLGGGGSYRLSGNLQLTGPTLTGIGTNTSVQVMAGGNITNGTSGILKNLTDLQGNLGFIGTNFSLTAPVLTVNGGGLDISGGTLTTGFVQNNGGFVSAGPGATLKTSGFDNHGYLTANGTVDLRNGTLDSFRNLDAATETLSGGNYLLSANGTLLYDGGSGAHAGQIIHIASDVNLELARGGQIQTGIGLYDALGELTSNAGALTLAGGNHSFLPVGGTFTNTSTGQMAIYNGASLRVYGALANDGNLSLQGALAADSLMNSGTQTAASGSYTSIFGDVQNTGTLSIGDAYGAATFTGANVSNAGTLNLTDSVLQASGAFTQTAGTTTLTAGGISAVSSSLEGGLVTGEGNFYGDVDNSGGTIMPDGGGIAVIGNYTQHAGGTLEEKLGVAEFLSVSGDATLDGIFEGLDFFGGSVNVGDSFEILHFDGKLIGNFMAFDLPSIAGITFQEVIGTHDITLVAAANGGTTTATPEPSFFWLGGGLLSAVVVIRRRR